MGANRLTIWRVAGFSWMYMRGVAAKDGADSGVQNEFAEGSQGMPHVCARRGTVGNEWREQVC